MEEFRHVIKEKHDFANLVVVIDRFSGFSVAKKHESEAKTKRYKASVLALLQELLQN